MKLESEVGPIRYIAEFVYGDEADRDLLEEAVRWVIITIIFVFDPICSIIVDCFCSTHSVGDILTQVVSNSISKPNST